MRKSIVDSFLVILETLCFKSLNVSIYKLNFKTIRKIRTHLLFGNFSKTTFYVGLDFNGFKNIIKFC